MLIADLHTHPLLNMVYLGRDLSFRRRPPRFYNPLRNQVDLARAWQAGIEILGFTTYVPLAFPWSDSWLATLASFSAFRRLVEANPERIVHVRNAAELDAALEDKMIAAFLGVEGGHVIGEDLDRVRQLADAGVWYVTLVHFVHNQIGPTCHTDPSGRRSLTPFGRRLVTELENHGIRPDVAHLSEKAFWETLEIARGPVLYTHGAARALCDHPRNLRDEQLRALARTGGLIGLILFPHYLRRGRWRGDLELVLDHAEHIAGLVGEDHLCLGSDLDGYITTVRPLRDITGLPLLFERMAGRFGETFARKVAGQNVLRVMRETWRSTCPNGNTA